ncbi:MAG: M43 family zinc metalloprotease, partial [Bacteroidota bacterium]
MSTIAANSPNESFANGPNFTPSNGVDVEIEFCLAERDPDGNVSTGVVFVDDPISSNFNKDTDDLTIKNMSRWDPTAYCNIYSVANIQGSVAGYAYLPGSHGSSVDGIVVEDAYIIGSVSGIKVMSHEMGHYLGLRHTWQGGCPNNDCLTDGDAICDTPPDNSQSGSNCASPQNTCQTDDDDLSTNNPFRPTNMGGLGDQPDMESNYMDYSSQSCQNAFTQGQKDLMISALTGTRGSLITPTNLAATGCQCEVATPCTPSANFAADEQFICPNQTVNFTDLSSGPAASWSWSFQGGTPATATTQNPTVLYGAAGVYEVSLTITNNAGNSTETRTTYINVVDASPPPIAEGFETALPSDWVVTNWDGGGQWEITDTTGYTGLQSIVMDYWNFPSNGTPDDFTTRLFDLSNAVSATFTFDYAHQVHSFPFTYDTLQVWVSGDCGQNWTMEWEKGASDLSTVGGINFASRFVPTMQSEWANASIDLSSYLGMDGVKVRFRGIGQVQGQSIYIDNINIAGVVNTPEMGGHAWNLEVVPNPFNDALRVDFELETKSELRFSLYDLTGQQIHVVNAGRLAPGMHS